MTLVTVKYKQVETCKVNIQRESLTHVTKKKLEVKPTYLYRMGGVILLSAFTSDFTFPGVTRQLPAL